MVSKTSIPKRLLSAANLLLTERAPLFVTAFVGAVAWSFSHVVDRAGDAPIVAYCQVQQTIRDIKLGEINRTTVRVQHLSKSKSFKRVVLILKRANDSVDTLFLTQHPMSDLKGIPPAPPGDAEVDVDIDAAQFTIPNLPPLARFELTAHYRGHTKPVLVGDSNALDSYILEEESIHTFVLRNERTLIWGSLGVWLALIILWTVFFKQDKPAEDH